MSLLTLSFIMYVGCNTYTSLGKLTMTGIQQFQITCQIPIEFYLNDLGLCHVVNVEFTV